MFQVGDKCEVVSGYPDDIGKIVTLLEYVGEPKFASEIHFTDRRKLWRVDGNITWVDIELCDGAVVNQYLKPRPLAAEEYLRKIDPDDEKLDLSFLENIKKSQKDKFNQELKAFYPGKESKHKIE